jgi:hypothetical protein
MEKENSPIENLKQVEEKLKERETQILEKLDNIFNLADTKDEKYRTR